MIYTRTPVNFPLVTSFSVRSIVNRSTTISGSICSCKSCDKSCFDALMLALILRYEFFLLHGNSFSSLHAENYTIWNKQIKNVNYQGPDPPLDNATLPKQTGVLLHFHPAVSSGSLFIPSGFSRKSLGGWHCPSFVIYRIESIMVVKRV